MTTAQYILHLFTILAIIDMTAFAVKSDGAGRFFSWFAVVCFALSLVVRLTATYIGI